jgi:two-component sensor histidine kinase
MEDYRYGIRFFNGHEDTPGSQKKVLYAERNDTIRAIATYDSPCDMAGNGKLFDFSNDKLVFRRLKDDGSSVALDSCAYTFPDKRELTGNLIIGTKTVNYKRYTNKVRFFDVKTCSGGIISFHDDNNKPDPVSMIISDGYSPVVIITQQFISIADSSLHIVKRYAIRDMVDDTFRTDGARICGFMDDPFWSKCIATQNTGVLFPYSNTQLNTRIAADLSDYQWIGNATGDTVSYWWNYKMRTLMCIGENGTTTRERHENVYDAVRMIPYKKDTSLLAEKIRLYYYIHSSHTTIPAATWYRHNMPGKQWERYGLYTRDLEIAAPGRFYIGGNGFMDCTLSGDSMQATAIDAGRCNHLLYDVAHRIYWGYYNDHLLLYNPQNRTHKALDGLLPHLGISGIEQMATDSAGNIFIKDHNRLLMIDPRNGTISALFSNYNLKDARFIVKNGLVVLAAKFGILFCHTQDVRDKRKQLVFPNIKNGYYFQVVDMAVMKNKLLLKTDRCAYLVSLPTPDAFTRLPAPAELHRVIVNYRDTLYNIPAADSLNITNASDRLLLDVISPQGNGAVRYKYLIAELDNKWHELNSNELKLPALDPGRTYHLYLTAADDVWISDELPVILYMVPQWWQTPGWSVAISVCIVILIALVLLLVILLTRHFVNKAANRRQFMNNLELRAIHAQINPHFIFNTLNTALYFIKKEKTTEAADHVSRFSRLLRTYLESAHKRYSSITDEIASIKTYIELQQTRFDDIFSYEITVKDNLNTDVIHIPSLLLQPLIENAINHGLTPKGKGGHLEIVFSLNKSGTGICCVVDDNGIGRRQAAANRRHSDTIRTSHGSRLTEELVDVFNRYEKMGIDIQYFDKELPETGTTVSITIRQPRYER